MRAEAGKLEAAIGHHFSNPRLLERALTHRSHAHEKIPPSLSRDGFTLHDNEQLEFLGDSILGFLVSEWLVTHFPDDSEGQLSRRKAHLVSSAHLYEIAQKLDLGSYLQLGRGEEMSGGRMKKTLLVDALEAMIAAMYLDGGIEPVRRFVAQYVVEESVAHPGDDSKTALQELAHARGLPLPRYHLLRSSGPEHAKTFTVEVRLGTQLRAQAEGSTKKAASQRAAREALARLRDQNLDHS